MRFVYPCFQDHSLDYSEDFTEETSVLDVRVLDGVVDVCVSQTRVCVSDTCVCLRRVSMGAS